MQLGMIGLGRMGANMVRRLLRDRHECVVFDLRADAIATVAAEGARPADSLVALVAALAPPRHVWLMVPAGAPTETALGELAGLLEPGDAVIDGGNAYFKDDIRRARELAARGIAYADAGTSGGIHGLERGYCLMIGGEPALIARLDPILRSLAPGPGAAAPTPGRDLSTTAEHGYLHCGPAGSGHFVKMVHNGIEYGMMQALAEGFAIMRGAASPALDYHYELPVGEIAELWRRGSVLSSWLVDLTATALAADPALARFTGRVQDSGEGRWTVMTAVEQAIPADVISAALYTRFRSCQAESFAEKLLSAMRRELGGHPEPMAGE